MDQGDTPPQQQAAAAALFAAALSVQIAHLARLMAQFQGVNPGAIADSFEACANKLIPGSAQEQATRRMAELTAQLIRNAETGQAWEDVLAGLRRPAAGPSSST